MASALPMPVAFRDAELRHYEAGCATSTARWLASSDARGSTIDCT